MVKKYGITPVILAGGQGQRLWPLSRESFPKQFISFLNKLTMLQMTVVRLSKMKLNEPIIICNKKHVFVAKEQMENIKFKCTILAEPLSKNTAPSIALASLVSNPETTLLVLSADHIINDEKIFKEQIYKAYANINRYEIILFGVEPTSPDTNYGYIEAKKINNTIFEVKSFKEKPNIRLAKKYLKNNDYFWNSGIFMFSAKTYLNELSKYNSPIIDICKETIKNKKIISEIVFFDEKYFSKCPNISIDNAIMEYTKNAYMLPLNTHWIDIGNWFALHEILKGKDGNFFEGKCITHDTNNTLIMGLKNKIIATNGVKDLIIVDTNDSLLISSKKQSDNIKFIYENVKRKFPKHLEFRAVENRPWGHFEVIIAEEEYKVKKLFIKSGGQLSFQKHNYRSEHWVVVSGIAEISKGKKKLKLLKNESTFIPKGMTHSVKNLQKEVLIIIETQVGSYLGEDDIERFSDIYNR